MWSSYIVITGVYSYDWMACFKMGSNKRLHLSLVMRTVVALTAHITLRQTEGAFRGPNMRPLTDDETKMVFAKLEKFIGTEGIAQLIDRKDAPHVFRLHQNRVYYLSEAQVREITNFSRDHLISTGICVGKVTHSGKFRLTIHVLEVLAQFAKHKVWLKPSAEMSYLYGHNVTKVGLSKVTEGIPQNAGLVVFSETQIPLGFGVSAQPTDALPNLDPTALVVLNYADNGEWLRSENELV